METLGKQILSLLFDFCSDKSNIPNNFVLNSRISSDAMEYPQMKLSPKRPPGQSSHDDNMPFPLDVEPVFQDESPFVSCGPKPSQSNRFPIHNKFGKSPDNSSSRHTGILTRYGFENNNHDCKGNNNRVEDMVIQQRRDYSGSTPNNTVKKISVAQAPPATPSSDGTCFIF
jgi:hypothetical protein